MVNGMARACTSGSTKMCTSENGKMTNYLVRAPSRGPMEILIQEIGKVTNAMALARTSMQATATSILDIGNTANDAASFCR